MDEKNMTADGPYKSDDEIAAIGRRVVDCTLPKAAWTHAAHLAAAAWVIACSGLDPARDMPGIIRAYNEACGVANTDSGGYHDTITQASLRAVRAFLASQPAGTPLHTACNRLLASPYGDKSWLLNHWSQPVLFSVAARRGWVDPDLAPMSFGGTLDPRGIAPINPQDILERANKAFSEGRFADALSDHLWFSQNALAFDSRLLFVHNHALCDWARLARQYAPARAALLRLREQEAGLLLQGSAREALADAYLSRSRFGDIQTIDEALGQERATYELFLELRQRHPALAASHFNSAFGLIVAHEGYELVREYLPDPMAKLRQDAQCLSDMADGFAGDTSAPSKTRMLAETIGYAEHAAWVVTALRGLGEKDEADRFEAAAIALLATDALRDAVRAEFAAPGRIMQLAVAHADAAFGQEFRKRAAASVSDS